MHHVLQCLSFLLVNYNVFHPVFTADSGVSSAMQLEEFSNQQNGNYQPHLESVSAIRLIYSPSALVEPQRPQGLNQQLTAPAPDGNYIQASTQSEESVHQQTAARLHPGTYQQADAQRQPYQSLTVSQTFLTGLCKFSILVFVYYFFLDSNDSFVILISDQHRCSYPLIGNQPLTKSAACVRHGSASLVEMLKYGKHSQTEMRNPCSSSCLLQDVVSQNTAGNPNCPFYDSHQNQSFLSCNLPQNQGFSHDSARHLTSPPCPLNLQCPTELCLSALNILQSQQHCRTRSVLLNDAPKIGRPRGNTCIPAFPASSQFTSVSKPHSPTSHLTRSPPFHHSTSPSPPSNTRTDSTISPPSQSQPLWSVYEGRDLTLLNQRLHRIISLRNSSPNLSASNPVNNQGNFGGSVSEILDNRDRSQSMYVPLFFNPSQDRNSLSPYDTKGRPSPLVG